MCVNLRRGEVRADTAEGTPATEHHETGDAAPVVDSSQVRGLRGGEARLKRMGPAGVGPVHRQQMPIPERLHPREDLLRTPQRLREVAVGAVDADEAEHGRELVPREAMSLRGA